MEGASQNPQVVEPRRSTSGDGPDEDPPRRSENKRKRFHPFRAVRNIFSRKAKRQGSDEVQGSSKKSRSTSELSRVPTDVPQFPGLAPPYAVGLSVSHESIFTPEHGNAQEDLQGSSQSVQNVGLKGFKDELFTRVRARRDSDDDDVGLPHSPCTSPTTADVLAQGLKDKSSKSRSTCSASSLLSMGSSENDEDSTGQLLPSRFSYTDHNRSSEYDSDLEAAQPIPLNHNAALHKIAVRPKRTHGLPHHRKLQQMAASAVRPTLPATPEVTEDAGKHSLATPSPSPPDQEDVTIIENENVSTEEVNIQENEPMEDITMTPSVMETLKVSEIPSVEEDPFLLPLEKEIHIPKGKSAAAELKLRHEIKEFSKRQNEKREGLAKESISVPEGEEEGLLEIVDVKDSIKSLEATIVTGETDCKNSDDIKPKDNIQDKQPEGMESWCTIELGENRDVIAECRVEKANENNAESPKEHIQKTVISVTDVNVHSSDFETVATKTQSEDDVKKNSTELLPPEKTNQKETPLQPINSGTQNIPNSEDTNNDQENKTSTVQEEIPIAKLHSHDSPERQKSIPSESQQHSGIPDLVELKTDHPSVIERSRVVLRRHMSNRTVSQTPEVQKDIRVSADMTSSPNFSDIMKHRRSLVDSESTSENTTILNRSISEESSKNSGLSGRVSVEIIPFSQRSKNTNYLPSSPPKKSGDDKIQFSDKDEKSNQIPPDSSSEMTSEVAGPTKPDRMQYPIRFRIRKGSRSFSEVKESASNREELENNYSDPKPLLRPKPQLLTKDEAADKTTPEFMRIQLRSSKEELDKPEPTAVSSTATPQWEVKILQRQRSGPSSLPYIPVESKTETKATTNFKAEVNGNTSEKHQNEKSNDPKSQALDNDIVDLPKKEEMNNTKENNNVTEKTTTPTNLTNDDSAKISASSKNSNEPELFRVFARRSIKQKHSEKSTENNDTSVSKVEPPIKTGQDENFSKAAPVESSRPQNPKGTVSVQKLETKLSETPKKQELKVSVSEMPRKTEMASKVILKETVQRADSVEAKITPEETANKVVHSAKNVDSNRVEEKAHTNIPFRRNVTQSWIHPEVKQHSMDTSVHRRNSAPPEPKTSEKENVQAREPTQVTVNIQPQRPIIPLTRNDSTSKLMINNKDSGGNTPSWMQLAQQRREQREQKERMLYASTGSSSFVLEPNSRPSRNSKVLDMVNNFQKLQTT